MTQKYVYINFGAIAIHLIANYTDKIAELWPFYAIKLISVFFTHYCELSAMKCEMKFQFINQAVH